MPNAPRGRSETRNRGTIGNGNANDFTTGACQTLDLREIARNVKPRTIRPFDHWDVGHRLHADRCASPNGNLADMHASRRITRRFEVHELPLQEEVDDILPQQEDEQNE